MQRAPRPALLRAGAALQRGPRLQRPPWRRLCHAAAHSEREPRRENVAGDFYVDHTCIDCDTCRWMAPLVFARAPDGMSAVAKQPEGAQERREALQALLSCPTFSIHARNLAAGELAAARDSFPLRVEGTQSVYRTGHHAEASFGATPYFIRRGAAATAGAAGEDPTSGGNILVDVPRWSPALAQRLGRLGGVRWIFLTHCDDVGDHAKWAAHFGAARIIHRLEVDPSQGTDAAEWQLEGEGPWALGEDVELIATPGHTAGCVSLLYRPDRALFTGDHLAYSARLGRLTIFRAYNWHSVPQQLESVHKLLAGGYDFLHVLPGHGRAARLRDAAHREAELRALLEAEGWRPAAAG